MGEQLWYAIRSVSGDWLGVLVFCAASRRLRARARWIGWSEEQRRRRRPRLVNNGRFLLLPHKTLPHRASRSLRLSLDRLSRDWQARYGHPVVLVETFVDPETLAGTGYTANAGQELGLTDGFGRVRRDFYGQPHKPKRLLVRALGRHTRRSLPADKLKPARAAGEAKTRPRSTASPTQPPFLGRSPPAPPRLSGPHRHLSAVGGGPQRRAGPARRCASWPQRPGQVCQGLEPGPTTGPGRAPPKGPPLSGSQPPPSAA